MYVGSHHIEYDLNCFTGCSGAIFFYSTFSLIPFMCGGATMARLLLSNPEPTHAYWSGTMGF